MRPEGRAGRFAPSPTGDLHVGNLRTAVASWLDARSRRARWVVRFEDLDATVATRDSGHRQLADLGALGMESDGALVWQSDHRQRYQVATDQLVSSGRTYPCFCTRREIREAIASSVNAPNSATGSFYPGTCAGLSRAEQGRRAKGRSPALRFRAEGTTIDFDDSHFGEQSVVVDDFVVRRNDGLPAYNLVVVVDDADAGVGAVVRAADLLPSTARQILVAQALGIERVAYAHVPLVVNHAGQRLAKRDVAITLAELRSLGWGPERLLDRLAASMGLAEPGERPTLSVLVDRWATRSVGVDSWQNVWEPPEGAVGDGRGGSASTGS